MSPSVELAEIRQLASAILNAGEYIDIGDLAEELALSIQSLDDMLTSGMPLPIDWEEA